MLGVSKEASLPFLTSQIKHTNLRDELELKYKDRLKERLGYRRLVTYVPNKNLPVYNWFKYKEGFSRQLVFNLLRNWKIIPNEIILDPFAGCGTTLLACKELGYRGVGVDILPVAVFVARVKLEDWKDINALSNAVDSLMSTPFREPAGGFPDVKIVNLAFSAEVQREVLFFKEEILEKYEKPIQNFLMLGLLSILEKVSFTSKDGQFLRLIERKTPPVRDTLRQHLSSMLLDLRYRELSLSQVKRAKVEIYEGDARAMSLPSKYKGQIAAVITSPPYLNRYDYSRTYSLELCTLFVNKFDELREIRHSLLRSHIESRVEKDREIKLPALKEILDALAKKDLNNNRIPIMIEGYFEDMAMSIQSLTRYLKPGGRVALVVANARFEGEMVPTDLLLSELAAEAGLQTEEIWVTRYKGNSSQQMAKYGRVPVRESILFWRKSA
ncbi:site-specific DNA-methyltransferase [bacterium]|nr:site-specific DNA-methyltransferase [bacterium]